MKKTAGMKLVFGIGKCGFSLPVKDLVEIREDFAGAIDHSGADAEGCLLGSLLYRGESIAVRDLGSRLQVVATQRDEGRPILLLCGDGAPWGAVVDRIEGLFAEEEFSSLQVPPLATLSTQLPYQQLDVWRDEVLVACNARWLGAMWESDDR